MSEPGGRRRRVVLLVAGGLAATCLVAGLTSLYATEYLMRSASAESLLLQRLDRTDRTVTEGIYACERVLRGNGGGDGGGEGTLNDVDFRCTPDAGAYCDSVACRELAIDIEGGRVVADSRDG